MSFLASSRSTGGRAEPSVRRIDVLEFDNPLGPDDRLRFRLTEGGPVHLELIALSGRHGCVVLDGPLRSGWHSVDLPEAMRPGTYTARLSTASGRVAAMVVITR